MANTFLSESFLLENETAERLYFEHAQSMPIFDYHSHLPVNDIADDASYENITKAWLSHDHYKWRVMRTNGISERSITGNASDVEKFKAWANTVPYTIRNPLYHWTHMELKFFFGIDSKLLGPDTAESIYKTCNNSHK